MVPFMPFMPGNPDPPAKKINSRFYQTKVKGQAACEALAASQNAPATFIDRVSTGGLNVTLYGKMHVGAGWVHHTAGCPAYTADARRYHPSPRVPHWAFFSFFLFFFSPPPFLARVCPLWANAIYPCWFGLGWRSALGQCIVCPPSATLSAASPGSPARSGPSHSSTCTATAPRTADRTPVASGMYPPLACVSIPFEADLKQSCARASRRSAFSLHGRGHLGRFRADSTRSRPLSPAFKARARAQGPRSRKRAGVGVAQVHRPGQHDAVRTLFSSFSFFFSTFFFFLLAFFFLSRPGRMIQPS